MKNKSINRLVVALGLATGAFFVLTAESCDGAPPTAQQQEQAQQARAQAEGQASVGPVNIVNWTQKRQFKAILEAFDQPDLITYSYLVDRAAHLQPLCRSQGYGFNEGTEYTNPQQISWMTSGNSGIASGVIAQQDPNGLYSPQASMGTLLLCLTKDKKVLPVRSEPDVITLPVPYEQLDRTGM